MIFMKATGTWDKNKSAFSTFLFTCLSNGLQSFVSKNDQPPRYEVDFEQAYGAHELSPDRSMEFKEMLASLSEEARHVALLLLEGPVEILGITGMECAKKIRGAITRYLQSKFKCSHCASWKILNELKTHVLSQ